MCLQLDSIVERAAGANASVGRLKSALSQMFGSVDKMLQTEVDAVLTGELSSGKSLARNSRKSITLRAQALLDRIEATMTDMRR